MIIDNAFNNDESRFGRFLQRSAHWMIYVLPVVITGQFIADVVNWSGFSESRPWLAILMRIIVFAANAFSVLFIIHILHNRYTRLCIRCVQGMPEDAPARAEKRDRTLRMFHSWTDQPRRTLYLLAALCVASLVSRTWTSLGSLSDIPFLVWIVVMMTSDWTHHRLRPWCRYCKDWGSGGMREPSPDPVDYNLIKS